MPAAREMGERLATHSDAEAVPEVALEEGEVETLRASVRRWRRVAGVAVLVPLLVGAAAVATPWPRWWVAATGAAPPAGSAGELAFAKKVSEESTGLFSGCVTVPDAAGNPSQICCATVTGAGGTSSCSPYCFPGQSSVQVRGQGPTALASLRSGDEVLVERAAGQLAFEPVLGFLHAASAGEGLKSAHVAVTHAGGEFRASPSHLVMVDGASGREDKQVAELVPGDRLLVVAPEGLKPSEVLAVSAAAAEEGMFAPLTRAGTIIVDGVVASQYASPVPRLGLPHAAAHAAFFPARAYHALGFALPVTEAGLHPYAAFMYETLRTDLLLKRLSGW